MDKSTVLLKLVTMYDNKKELEKFYSTGKTKQLQDNVIYYKGKAMAIKEVAWEIGFTEQEFDDMLRDVKCDKFWKDKETTE